MLSDKESTYQPLFDDVALRQIVEGVECETGERFFPSLVEHLASAFGSQYAFVSELLDDRVQFRTRAVWGRGKLIDNFQIPFTGTPCEPVLKGLSTYHSEDLQKLFPTNPPFLGKWGVESYCGVPLFDSSGAVAGHLAILCEEPMRHGPRGLAIMRIFAARAQAEIERLRAENALRVSAEELDWRVAQRTAELARINEELRKEIIERRRAEEALRDREESFRLIVDGISGLVATMSPVGQLEVVNRQVLEYFGKTIEELKGWSMSDVVHSEDLPGVISAWTRSVETGSVYDVDHRLRRVDGEYRWFHARGLPLRGPDEGTIRWYVLLTDIHDRKRAEEAVLASERNLTLNINAMPTLLASARPDGWGDFFNERWRKYTGLSPEELKGWGWADPIHPEDTGSLLAIWRSSLDSGAPLEAEARMRRFDGTYRWHLFRANALCDESGNVVKWYGSAVDIDDRKRAEDILRTSELSWREIVDNIPGLVATLSAGGAVEFMNRQILEYFGRGEGDLRNWSLIGAIHPDDLPRVIADRTKAIDTGLIYESVHRLRRRDGVYRWFQLRGFPVRNVDGKLTRWYLLLTDVDERVQAEEKLRRNESSLLEAQRLGHSGSWSLDVSSGLVSTSPEISRIFDVKPGDNTSSPDFWFSRIHHDDRKRVRDLFEQCLIERTDYEADYRLLLSDGTIRYQHSLGRPIVNESGILVEFVGTAIDVTEQVEARTALQKALDEVEKSEDQLLAIINTIPTLAWSADADGSADFLNQRWLEFTGLSSEQAQGWGWGAAIHPDDVERLVELWRASLASGMPVETEARMRRHDGCFRWFLFRASPLRDELGNIVKWYGTNIDIDERKQAEEMLRRSEAFLAEGQRVGRTGNFSFQIATDKVKFSEQMYHIFGFDPSVPVSVEQIRDRVHPEDRPVFFENLGKARRGECEIENDLRLLMPDDSVTHIHILAHGSRGEGGQLECVGTVQDITQRQLAEEAVAKARSELAHLSRVASLGVLTASIAHEVNQPLTGIITNATTCLLFLNDDVPDIGAAREITRRIIRDGNRASDVITRLRTLFRRKEVTVESVDLNDAVREVIALSLSELQRNSVILRQELDEGLPRIQGDRVQLQQVILNLLRNASDAMSTVEDRPRQMCIRTEKDEKDCVRLTVKDAGIGFNPQLMDKLFEGFFTTKREGMGIGLSISRSIIDAHNGRLWAKLNDGPGSTFAFSIPCHGPVYADNIPPRTATV